MKLPYRTLRSAARVQQAGCFILALFFALTVVNGAEEDPVRIGGSAVMVEAYSPGIERLREEIGIEAKIGGGLNAASALNAVGLGVIDLALVTRPITQADRSQFPSRRMTDVLVGWQVLLPVVPAEIWEQGIKTISRTEFIGIYEGTTKSWKSLGAEDRAIKFFNPEKGHGSWELFAAWLYDESRRAPLGDQWESISTARAMRDAVEFNSASISVLPPKWIDGKGVFGLAVKSEDGATIRFTEDTVRDGTWPMVRPLYVVSGDRPSGRIRKVMEALAGEIGRGLLEEAALIPRNEAREDLLRQIR
jgi:phosphate transport system substrate-binding protein